MDEQKPDEELQEEVTEIEQAAEQPVEAPVEKPVEAAPVKQELPKKLVEQPKQIGAPVPGRMERLKAFILECKRVLRVTKKPDRAEFTTIVKISAIGMGIIGIVGFLIHFAKELLL
ncbi:MAG TPA: protein translocase SEC61 complex subunit gamma [Candidatus Nanoarchaeia archaeon]|nr:protein translocase SEC61 complex subunit gamma [Candidatus Nanoarchaeia archaeon]